MSTRDKIIEQALSLFSTRGYTAVTVEEIARAVGIKAPSLYKHFSSKQAIFLAIIEQMTARYREKMTQFQLNGADPASDTEVFETISEDQLIVLGQELFNFFLHDQANRQFRRMLVLEQFHNTDLGGLYIKQHFDDPINFQEKVFSGLIERKVMRSADAKTMALQFYAPIHCLIVLCDAMPEREAEAKVMLEQHIRQFNQIYRVGE